MDFLNKSPFEQTMTLTIIDRFLLAILLLPDQINQLIETFLISHYGGLLHEKSLSPIEDVYQLTRKELLKPTNNIILLWINSNAFLDPTDEIRRIVNEMKQSVRLVSYVQIKRFNRLNHRKKETCFIITDIHLFNDDLIQIQDFLFSSIDIQIRLICDPFADDQVPNWLIERCLQVYISQFSQSSLFLYLQQKISTEKRFAQSEKQFEEILQIHAYLTENDFSIGLKHCLKTSRMNMIDYRNYIQNQDEHLLVRFLQQVNSSLLLFDI